MDERKIAGHLCFINQGSGADTMTYCNKVDNLVKTLELDTNKHYGAPSRHAEHFGGRHAVQFV